MNDRSPKQSVTIKKYANRRLYNTATSSYVTLEDLSVMVKEGTEFNVYDAKTGDELTRAVLTQIIVEEEGKSGQNLLPVGFLRQLISFYGDNMQWMVPKYLEQSMQLLTKNQDQLREYFQNTMGTMFPFGNIMDDMNKQNPAGTMFPFGNTLGDMGKQNMAMFEKAMTLFSPFMQQQADAMAATMETAKKNTACSSATSSCCSTSTNTATTNKSADCCADTNKNAKQAEHAACDLSSYRSAAAAAPNVTKLPSSDSPEEMQQKISNLQKQLAELAKRRG